MHNLYIITKPGGLDLSWCRVLISMLSKSASRQLRKSRQRQKVRLGSRENLDSVKKCVWAVEKSRSRSRLLDFISTLMSRPKSLDRDREICRDMKFSAFLDSLSWSRNAWIFAFSRQDFSIRRDFSSFSDSKGLDCVSTNLDNLDTSWQISTISTHLDNLDNLDKNLDKSKSRLKSLDFKNLDQEKKIWSGLSQKSQHFKKVVLDTKDNLDLNLDWSWLLRPPGLIITNTRLGKCNKQKKLNHN